MKFKKVNLFNN